MNIIGWLGFLLSLTDQILVLYKKKNAFIIWNIANIIWLALALLRKDMPQVFMFSMYIFVNIVSFIKWKSDDVKNPA